MQHTSSFDQSKALYDISGWKGTANFWMKHAVPEPPFTLVRDGEFYGFGDPRYGHTDVPAYDLGYLLRQLPETLRSDDELLMFRAFDGGSKRWWISGYGYLQDGLGEFSVRADTPEDAAAKLAIELFKSGVLVREVQG